MTDEMPLVKTVTIGTGTGIPAGTTLETPEGMPTLVVKVVGPFRRIVTRVLRVYINSLVGMLTLVMSGAAADVLVTPADFVGKLTLAAGFALAPAVITLLTNAAEILAKLDNQA